MAKSFRHKHSLQSEHERLARELAALEQASAPAKKRHPVRNVLVALSLALTCAAAGVIGFQAGTSPSGIAAEEAASEAVDQGAAESQASEEVQTPEEAHTSLAWVAGDEFLAYVDSYVAAHPEADSGDYVELDDNVPYFTAEDATTEAFQSYAALDNLGRCVCAYACLGTETLATGERGDIYDVRPTGWHSGTYDFLDSVSLYTRSHLIAFSLSGQNDNERNLITGTWHMNVDVMSVFELMVLDYIRSTHNHVLYRVIPVFSGNELVARGIHMEALSMEDGGQGLSLNVYLRNIEPGVAIDYATGNSWPDGTVTADTTATATAEQAENAQDSSGQASAQ